MQSARGYFETFESTSEMPGAYRNTPYVGRCTCSLVVYHRAAVEAGLGPGELVISGCAVAMPCYGRGSKKRTTSGDDPPGNYKETEVVDITPAPPVKRAREPSGRKAAAAQESQRIRQRRATQKAPATPVKEPGSAAVPLQSHPQRPSWNLLSCECGSAARFKVKIYPS